MTAIGLEASEAHVENGMTRQDMIACREVASRHNEVIIFRSTGPWSKRWIEMGYPTKNFHVKGKSSDWGPQAGLVPYDGRYSKVGHDTTKAANGTAANDKGIASGFAGKAPLFLTRAQLQVALTRAEESPKRTALDRIESLPGSEDLVLWATRPGDGARVAFVAQHAKVGPYAIMAFEGVRTNTNPFIVRDEALRGRGLVPLEVMISNEVGAGAPMTGDYDLMAVCPSWGDYGSATPVNLHKQGLLVDDPNRGLTHHAGIGFLAGTNMDKVLDPRLHTMGKGARRNHQLPIKTAWEEHGDMGNLTPRLLRTINALNQQMPNGSGARRRVHHNAESHRNYRFGAITGDEMAEKNEGFPLTVFQPPTLTSGRAIRDGLPTARYADVCTLETHDEFTTYAAALHQAGFYVPKNWTWNMGSIWADARRNFAGGTFG